MYHVKDLFWGVVVTTGFVDVLARERRPEERD